MTSASAAAVSVRGVSVRYPGKRPGEFVDALDELSFEVAPGELVCIVGASGCGKSTLLNVIGGFLRPTRGEVRVQGEAVRGPDPRRVFVFQESGVFPWLTVEQNIGFGVSRRPAEERRRIVTHYLEMVGLAGFERAYPHELSGGMRRRVEIARALAAGDVRAERFASYQATLARGIEAWRELVLLYCRLPRLVLALLDTPEDRAALQDMLQGTVFGAEPPALLERLRRELGRVEADPAHPWHRELQAGS
jgi:ABC-type uncharacterized transport system YnjBCD ATPase subunit